MARGGHRNGRQRHGGDAMNARGTGKQRQKQRGRQKQSQRGVESAPNAAFLAALEAQRAKQAAESADAAAPCVTMAEESKRAALPGFYYDETKGRYFRLTPQLLRLEKRRRMDPAPPSVSSATTKPTCSISRIYKRGWVGLLTAREIQPRRQSQELIARVSASRLVSQTLKARVGVVGRYTAMDVARNGQSVVVGNASGVIHSYHINSLGNFINWGCNESGLFAISSIRHRPNSPAIAISAIGAGVDDSLATLLPRAGSSNVSSGRVALFTSASLHEPPVAWALNDPWVVEWSPTSPDLLAVGLHCREGAAIIHTEAGRTGSDGIVKAPSGRIESDTLSQTFFPAAQSPVIVNGSRNGSWWLWDTRAPRRASEDFPRRQPFPRGAVVCLRMLHDERKLVLQRSNGELAVIDARQSARSPLLSITSARSHVFNSMLRFDVDETETVVVAPSLGDEDLNKIMTYSLNRGTVLGGCKTVSSLPFPGDMTSPHPIELVQIRETPRSLSLWGLSRNAVYTSFGEHQQNE